MEKYSCSLPSFFREVERKNMAANYAKIRDGGKGAGLHYRAFECFSRVVALYLRQLRREDSQIATRIREVGLDLPRTLTSLLGFSFVGKQTGWRVVGTHYRVA